MCLVMQVIPIDESGALQEAFNVRLDELNVRLFVTQCQLVLVLLRLRGMHLRDVRYLTAVMCAGAAR